MHDLGVQPQGWAPFAKGLHGMFDFELDDEDMDIIALMDRRRPSMLDVDDPREVERVYGFMDNPVITTLS